MDLDASVSALATLLQDDAALTAWRDSTFGTGTLFTVLKGNRTLQALRTSQIPALILDVEPMQVSQRVSNLASDVAGGIQCAIAWQENDPDTAYTQRSGLPSMIIQAVMADPRVGGTVRGANVAQVTPLDGDGSAPNVRAVRFRVAARWEVKKA